MSLCDREPTADERAGMAWWNALHPWDRSRLLRAVGDMSIDPTPAACWEVFGREAARNRREAPAASTSQQPME